MANFEPPPTYAEPVIIDKGKKYGDPGASRFNPIWLKWFLDFVNFANKTNSASGTVANITGGAANELLVQSAPNVTSFLAPTTGWLNYNGTSVGWSALPTATSSVLGVVKPDGTSILNTAGAISVTLASIGAQAAGTYVTPTTLNNGTLPVKGTNVQVSNVGGFKSSDGSAGYTGTVTTTTLVGKTITIKDGIIVSFS